MYTQQLKKCGTCKVTKDISLFHGDRTRKDGKMRICKECSNARDRRRYHAKAPMRRKRKMDKLRYARNQRFIDRVKTYHGCSICGYKDHSVALGFHLDPSYPKRRKVMCNTWSRERVKTEMKKCRILCATCHKCITNGIKLAPSK